VVGVTYEQYRRLLLKVCKKLGLQGVGWTPHSPRSGFASGAIAEGQDFISVREAGRWVADSSLRTYIDLARTAQISTDLQISGLQPAVSHCIRHIDEFFPSAKPYLHEFHDAASRLRPGIGREVLPTISDLRDGFSPTVRAAEESGSIGHATVKGKGHSRGKGRGR
jgi:hypothetical protein